MVEADCNYRLADGAFDLDDTLYCSRICIKQPFIFTTWTSHMHFMHSFRLLYRGQLKGNVKLTVDYSFIFLCTYVRELVPKIAINKLYRTGVLASIIIYIYLRKHSNEVLFSFFQIKKQSKTEYQLRYFSVLLRLPTNLCRSS